MRLVPTLVMPTLVTYLCFLAGKIFVKSGDAGSLLCLLSKD
jgi:hypothetical protein